MKKIIWYSAILVFLACSPIVVYARPDALIVKQKKIHRYFIVKAGDVLKIQHHFGNVVVKIWNRNEVNIEITATEKAEKEIRALDILNNINIKEETDNNGNKYFGTLITTPYNNNNGVRKATKENKYNDYEANIVYVVTVPNNISLDIRNEFGDVIIGDFKGGLRLDIVFGSLHAKNISGPCKIKVDHSSQNNTIWSIEKGELLCTRGCSLTINKSIDTNVLKLRGWNPLVINNVKQ